MIYRLSLFLLMVAGSIFYVGCEGGGSSTTSLPGSWQAQTLTITDGDGNEQVLDLGADWTETVVFNEDGTYTFSATQFGSSSSGGGTYSQEGGVITFSGNPQNYILSGDTLTFTGTIPEGLYELVLRK